VGVGALLFAAICRLAWRANPVDPLIVALGIMLVVHVVDLLTGVLGLAFFGSLVIGPIVILVTLPAAVAWVAILRRRVRGRERSPS
jgi:hypothetical protein